MIGLLGWAGFIASFLIHVGSFFEQDGKSAGFFLMQVPCILLFFLAHRYSGLGNRRATRSDCAGLAADLLILVEPYTFLIFAWGFFGTHSKAVEPVIALRMFSSMWMLFFLTSSGLMARRAAAQKVPGPGQMLQAPPSHRF